MILKLLPFITIVFAISNSNLVKADRVSDKIYSVVQSNHYCNRRLNGTHQVGCQSELGGNLGVVWIVSGPDDLDHILKHGPTPPYVPILRKSYYTRKNLLIFKENLDRVSGVVFLDKEHDDSRSRTTAFSPDDLCPNRYSGLYVNDTIYGDCKHAWQEESPISGLLYEDIPYPVFLINDKKSIELIELCFNENNVILLQDDNTKNSQTEPKRVQAHYPLCGIQLDSFMLGAKDSGFCLNSHFMIDEILQSNGKRCETVDNNSIFAYYKPAIGPLGNPDIDTKGRKPETTPEQSIVLLVAKLSSISMFTEISPGADSTITSIVTLLAAAEALGKVKDSPEVTRSRRNIAFAIIDSEPFDYTGSSRMAKSMLDNSFPYNDFVTDKLDSMQNTNLSSIDYLINLDQLAKYPSSDTLYFKADPRDKANKKVDMIFEKMVKIATRENLKLERGPQELPLPPSSAQEFIKYSRSSDSSRLTGIVLSNYGRTYKNLFYNSIYDDFHNIRQRSLDHLIEYLTDVSKLVAKTLYELAFGVNDSSSINVNQDLIGELLDCYLVNASCDLFTRACRAGQKLPSGSVPTFKDPTKRSDDMNGIITNNLLAYFIGDKMEHMNYSSCYSENYHSLNYTYIYVNDKVHQIDWSSGSCIRSQVVMTSAFSPAYSRVDDEIVIDPNYPAWTVSLNGIRNPVRLYLIPSPVTQWLLVFVGVVVTLVSFILVRAVKLRMETIGSNLENQVVTST